MMVCFSFVIHVTYRPDPDIDAPETLCGLMTETILVHVLYTLYQRKSTTTAIMEITSNNYFRLFSRERF